MFWNAFDSASSKSTEHFHKMKYLEPFWARNFEMKNVDVFQQNKAARCSQKISFWMET